MQKILSAQLLVFFLFLSSKIFAHCPTEFKDDGLCFLLQEDKILSWDKIKSEHDGPYRDLTKKFQLVEVLSPKGVKIEFNRLSRGVWKISTKDLPYIHAVIENNSQKNQSKIKLKVSAEKN